jgi:hypothetical protein
MDESQMFEALQSVDLVGMLGRHMRLPRDVDSWSQGCGGGFER